MTYRYPVRFDHADDNAIRREFTRHRIVLESPAPEGKHAIQCKCGEAFASEKAEVALADWTEHFLAALKGSAA